MAVATFSQPDSVILARMAYTDVVIANGQSLSPAVDLGDRALVGILISAAWTAAGLTFQVSPDGVTYGNMKDAAAEVAVAALTAGDYVQLDPLKFMGARFIKIRSGTAGTPVVQGADRTLRLVCRDVQ